MPVRSLCKRGQGSAPDADSSSTERLTPPDWLQDPEHRHEQADLNWEHERGCCIPNWCLVVGDHHHGDCYTAAEAYEQAMRDAASAAPTAHHSRF